MSSLLVTIKALFALNCIEAPPKVSAGIISNVPAMLSCTPCNCGPGYGSSACLRYQADEAEKKEQHEKKCAEIIGQLQEAVK